MYSSAPPGQALFGPLSRGKPLHKPPLTGVYGLIADLIYSLTCGLNIKDIYRDICEDIC